MRRFTLTSVRISHHTSRATSRSLDALTGKPSLQAVVVISMERLLVITQEWSVVTLERMRIYCGDA